MVSTVYCYIYVNIKVLNPALSRHHVLNNIPAFLFSITDSAAGYTGARPRTHPR